MIVLSARPRESTASSIAPTPWSSERALSLNAAMSRRVSGVSGRFAGGCEYSASRTEVGSKKLRWVSKKPTERKKGCSNGSSSSSIVAGTTDSTWFESISTTRS